MVNINHTSYSDVKLTRDSESMSYFTVGSSVQEIASHFRRGIYAGTDTFWKKH